MWEVCISCYHAPWKNGSILRFCVTSSQFCWRWKHLRFLGERVQRGTYLDVFWSLEKLLSRELFTEEVSRWNLSISSSVVLVWTLRMLKNFVIRPFSHLCKPNFHPPIYFLLLNMAALQDLWFAEFMVASLFRGISNGNRSLPNRRIVECLYIFFNKLLNCSVYWSNKFYHLIMLWRWKSNLLWCWKSRVLFTMLILLINRTHAFFYDTWC